MNTWRDIKTDPPRPDQPVYVTDGISVCIGRIRKPDTPADWETFTFDGYNIPEGYPLQGDISLFNITEWQPAPDTWKPEKTADEMFRELGYLWEGTPENGREYECVDYNDVVTVTTSDVDFHGTDGGYRFVVPAKLVLACAQLIREMEADNG